VLHLFCRSGAPIHFTRPHVFGTPPPPLGRVVRSVPVYCIRQDGFATPPSLSTVLHMLVANMLPMHFVANPGLCRTMQAQAALFSPTQQIAAAVVAGAVVIYASGIRIRTAVRAVLTLPDRLSSLTLSSVCL
jgi:hypothetical protein